MTPMEWAKAHEEEMSLSGDDLAASARMFERAIMEERERCAKLADACHMNQEGLAPGDCCCGPRVALEIREQQF